MILEFNSYQARASRPHSEAKIAPCPHLAFFYIDEISEFVYQSKDFEARLAAIEEEEDCPGTNDMPALLKKAGYGSEMLALGISRDGMCHEPFSYVDIAGFDYGTLKLANQ